MLHPLAQLAQDVRTGQDRQHFWKFVIPAVASLPSNVAGGRAAGRQQAAATNLSRDQLTTQQNQIQQQAILQALLGESNQQTQNANTDLAQRRFTLEAPNARAGTAVRGDVLSRSQPLSIGFSKGQIPTFSGGPSLADLSPETKQLGQSMTRNALMQQLKGDTFDPLKTANWQGGVLPQPGQTPLPKANWFDKFLSYAAPIAGAAGVGSQAQEQSQTSDWIKQLLEQATAGTGASSGAPGGGPMVGPRLNVPTNAAGLPIGQLDAFLQSRNIPGWSYGAGG